jgi:hypothetical protein
MTASIFTRTGPASNLLLSRVVQSSSWIPDPVLEGFAEELPKVALDLANGADQIRLGEVLDVFAQHPLATDKRHGTLASTAIVRFRQEIAYMVQIKLPYLQLGDPVPLALPWTLARGGGRGRPLVLRREHAEVCEWLLQAELDHRAAEEVRRRADLFAPRRPWKPLPLPFPLRRPINFMNEEEDYFQ